jgi:hypothetical protein
MTFVSIPGIVREPDWHRSDLHRFPWILSSALTPYSPKLSPVRSGVLGPRPVLNRIATSVVWGTVPRTPSLDRRVSYNATFQGSQSPSLPKGATIGVAPIPLAYCQCSTLPVRTFKELRGKLQTPRTTKIMIDSYRVQAACLVLTSNRSTYWGLTPRTDPIRQTIDFHRLSLILSPVSNRANAALGDREHTRTGQDARFPPWK